MRTPPIPGHRALFWSTLFAIVVLGALPADATAQQRGSEAWLGVPLPGGLALPPQLSVLYDPSFSATPSPVPAGEEGYTDLEGERIRESLRRIGYAMQAVDGLARRLVHPADRVRTSRQLVQEKGREPLPEEIAERMGIVVSKVRKVLKIAQEPISLETPIGEEEDSHLADFIEDLSAESPIESVIQVNQREQMVKVLKSLSPREEEVLKMRFGITDGSEHTLEEVGRKFAVTRERIRQIESKALRKLRHPSRSRQLEAFLRGLR